MATKQVSETKPTDQSGPVVLDKTEQAEPKSMAERIVKEEPPAVYTLGQGAGKPKVITPEEEYEQLKKKFGPPPKRAPMHAIGTLDVHGKDPEYFYRWFNDIKEGLRLQEARNFGWEEVRDPKKVHEMDRDKQTSDPSRKGDGVVHKPVGDGITAVLMRIPRPWYDAYQKMKSDKLKAREEAMKLPKADGPGADVLFGKTEIHDSMTRA